MGLAAGFAMIAIFCLLAGDVLPWWFYALLSVGMVGWIVLDVTTLAMWRRQQRKNPPTDLIKLIALNSQLAQLALQDDVTEDGK